MSYSINYAPKDTVRYMQKKTKRRLPALALTISLLLSIFAAKLIWPETTQRLQQALFPWTQSAAQEAFSGFIHNIREGETFQSAVTTFCLEILANE